MKNYIKSIVLSPLLLLLAFGGMAYAADDQQVWRDSDGEIVRNSWDACVRSRWDVNQDACAEPVAPPPPAPAPRTMIILEQRTVYFNFNKTDLTPDAEDLLAGLANRLMAADDVTGVKIVGYADRIGTASYNRQLSKQRAKMVNDYLVGRGFAKPSVTETEWVGKSEAMSSCPNGLSHDQLVNCLQPDRRVTVELQYQAEAAAGPVYAPIN